MDATNVRELADAHREFRVISLEGVLADDAGDIARVTTGQVDVRPDGWTGAYPRKGWDLASREPAVLAESTRPLACGAATVVSANQQRSGPEGEAWCTLPEPHYRYERLTHLLHDPGPVDLRRLARASYDEHDGCAARLVPVWSKHLPDDADAVALRRWATLQGDRLDDAGRRLMGLFHALHDEVVRELLASRIGDAAATRIVFGLSAALFFQHHLDAALSLAKPHLLGDDELGRIVARAWPRAKERVKKGYDVPVRAKFKNMLLQGKLPVAFGFDSAPVLLPGGPVAPFQTRIIEFEGEKIVGGPAFHLAIDMSKPGAWYHVPGGAAEKRYGPGYGAGVDEWLQGIFLPMGDASGAPPNVGRPIG
jgi:acyl-homoserine lactone acylase PvdQ